MFASSAARVGILRPRVLVALVLAELVLHVRGGLEDRRDDGAGAGIGLLSGVDADGREARARREFHALDQSHMARRSTPRPAAAPQPSPRELAGRHRGSDACSSTRGRAEVRRLLSWRVISWWPIADDLPMFVRVVSGAATLGLAVALGTFAWRLFVLIKRRLLWRVRRKLILSVHLHRRHPVAADPGVLPVRRQPRVHERQRLSVQGRLRDDHRRRAAERAGGGNRDRAQSGVRGGDRSSACTASARPTLPGVSSPILAPQRKRETVGPWKRHAAARCGFPPG